jgi:sigma-E factor negative regulatory protein RseC
MLEMRAVVLSVRGDEAEISPLGSGCGHCSSVGGCGSGKLSQMFCSSEPRTFLVRNQVRAQVGDEVSVVLPDGVLLRSSWRMYGLPLLLLLMGGLVGISLAGETVGRDGSALIGSAVGLLSGFAWGKISSPARGPEAVVQSIVSARTRS